MSNQNYPYQGVPSSVADAKKLSPTAQLLVGALGGFVAVSAAIGLVVAAPTIAGAFTNDDVPETQIYEVDTLSETLEKPIFDPVAGGYVSGEISDPIDGGATDEYTQPAEVDPDTYVADIAENVWMWRRCIDWGLTAGFAPSLLCHGGYEWVAFDESDPAAVAAAYEFEWESAWSSNPEVPKCAATDFWDNNAGVICSVSGAGAVSIGFTRSGNTWRVVQHDGLS